MTISSPLSTRSSRPVEQGSQFVLRFKGADLNHKFKLYSSEACSRNTHGSFAPFNPESERRALEGAFKLISVTPNAESATAPVLLLCSLGFVGASNTASNPNSLDFAHADVIVAPVVKASSFRVQVPGHALRDLDATAVREVVRYPRGAKGVAARRGFRGNAARPVPRPGDELSRDDHRS
jgi:hypothetical protein